jgi:hypothetical protein
MEQPGRIESPDTSLAPKEHQQSKNMNDKRANSRSEHGVRFNALELNFWTPKIR